MTRPTFYDILEIKSSASQQDIREAYLRARAAYQKESIALYTLIPDDVEREALLQQVETAYLVLSDLEKRRLYDQNHSLDSGTGFQEVKERVVPKSRQESVPHQKSLGEELQDEIQQQEEWSGTFLRKIRLAHSVSLEELSQLTRISKHYLSALEEEAWDKLPAWVYVRGFLTQWAKIFKLPIDKILKSFANHQVSIEKKKG